MSSEMSSAYHVKTALQGYSNPRQILMQIERALLSGALQAKAATRTLLISETNRPTAENFEVPSSLWKRATVANAFDDLWSNGNILIPKCGKSCAVELIGVRLDKVRLTQIFDENSSDVVGLKQPGNRGRSTSSHAYPIVSLALDLLQRRMRGEPKPSAKGLKPELVAAYRAAGYPPPNDRNVEGMCSGILQAINAKAYEFDLP